MIQAATRGVQDRAAISALSAQKEEDEKEKEAARIAEEEEEDANFENAEVEDSQLAEQVRMEAVRRQEDDLAARRAEDERQEAARLAKEEEELAPPPSEDDDARDAAALDENDASSVASVSFCGDCHDGELSVRDSCIDELLRAAFSDA